MTGRIALATRDSFLRLAVDAVLRRSGHEGATHASSRADLARLTRDGPVDVVLIDERLSDSPAGAAAVPTPEVVIRVGAAPAELSGTRAVVAAGDGGRLDLGALGRLLPAAIAAALPREPRRPLDPRRALLVVGASTGGPEALVAMLSALGAPAVPAVVAIHMPADGTAAFAAHLGAQTGLRVVEVGQGALPAAGTVALLRGGADFRIERGADGPRLARSISPTGPFRPSLDVLFASAAEAGFRGDAVVLSGMGRDGAVGAARAEAAGWGVLAQAPGTCAVAGMPAAALAACRSAVALAPAAIGRRLAARRERGPAGGTPA